MRWWPATCRDLPVCTRSSCSWTQAFVCWCSRTTHCAAATTPSNTTWSASRRWCTTSRCVRSRRRRRLLLRTRPWRAQTRATLQWRLPRRPPPPERWLSPIALQLPEFKFAYLRVHDTDSGYGVYLTKHSNSCHWWLIHSNIIVCFFAQVCICSLSPAYSICICYSQLKFTQTPSCTLFQEPVLDLCYLASKEYSTCHVYIRSFKQPWLWHSTDFQ